VTLDQVSALRNFAAHKSDQSKRSALKTVNAARLNSSGTWLKVGHRFQTIADKLKALATELENESPY
jgi:hypothetical protein